MGIIKNDKVVFLDRDGVINYKAPEGHYIIDWSDFEFIPGSRESIKQLSIRNYTIFIVTNQACISKKLITFEGLDIIHNKMLKEIEAKGGNIKKIYFCPHSEEDNCLCRKPKPGMLIKASEEFGFGLENTILIGDSLTDIQAGESVGSQCYYIDKKEKCLLDIVNQIL